MSAPARAPLEPQPLVDETGADLRRPEVFFTKTWRGSGVASDAFGIPQDRYEVSFGPTSAPGQPLRVDHRIVFESGVTNSFDWALLPSRGDVIAARDMKSGANAKGRINDTGFFWAFNGRYRTPFGIQVCRHDVTISLSSPTELRTEVTVSFLGVTIGVATAHLRLVV